MQNNKHNFLSICILSYNRPNSILRLLESIDLNFKKNFEIIISDDCSPKETEIEIKVKNFSKENSVNINFIKNSKNQGYDKNFNVLVNNAQGKWLIFMGDDDEFVDGSLEKVINFLTLNPRLGYVMKSHYLIHDNNFKELFKYYRGNKFFKPGIDALISLFRKSVYIAGFIIKRELVMPFVTDRFDGSMLNQLYLMSEVVLKHNSAYLDIPFTQQYKSLEHNKSDLMYDRIKKKFIPREPTIEISIKFLKSYNDITNYIDKKYNLNCSEIIRKDMSKYLYPSISIHRDKGLFKFLLYISMLNKLKFNCSIYYYIYVIGLIIFKKKLCDYLIVLIKKKLGFTPTL